MKLTLTINSDRQVASRYGVGGKPEQEEYERTAVSELRGNARMIAGTLRAIADDIDPLFPNMEATESAVSDFPGAS